MSLIAFIGTGIMGAPMAANLARHGHEVRAWNRTRGKAEALAAQGVLVAGSAAEATQGADIAILMVSTGDVADAVLFGPGGIVATLSPGAIVVVMSSIPVDTSRAQAARLAALGIDYVDAPVSGGERGAIAATLSIMAGGDGAVIERLRPIFAAMGRTTHVGPVGSGQLAKLANQLIVGVTIGAVAEALLLAEAGGADVVAVRDALIGGFADSTILRQHGERMIQGNFVPGGHAEVQLKDLRTGRAVADAAGITLPFQRLAERLYADMVADGRPLLDHSALYLTLKDRMRG
ncbi:NAD(P)-dependent oxidoreductase [Niveispirillum sp.]|uniref:NAD(P)-dependent oxidoreductase n=1 Tax=Niveispirillum sp. TaxID=1917217 RepID=UPI001B76676A|nr:NAD(P)-dependent oxidoreductase [Niveispirillum sp.]MBP7336717.1 NAD(P)-dependent oxidoreductase [Niveispirillum sp.]